MKKIIKKIVKFFIRNPKTRENIILFKRKIIEKKYIDLILEYYKNTNDLEIREILEYMKKSKILNVFNYKKMDDYYDNLKVQSGYDEENKLYYVIHCGKRMYMSSNFSTKEKAENYYKGLLKEQYIKSPHRYLTNNFNLDKSKCLVDCGGAEGIFTLENIDKIEKAYIFECDEEWIKALKLTFHPYKNKVQIIEKFVSDVNNIKEMTLDDLQKNISIEVDFIKMDIEGAEIKALNGAKKILQTNQNLKLILCCYHRQDDEKNMREILKEFQIQTTKGYMLFWYNEGLKSLKAPFFRRGILRAEKKKGIQNEK